MASKNKNCSNAYNVWMLISQKPMLILYAPQFPKNNKCITIVPVTGEAEPEFVILTQVVHSLTVSTIKGFQLRLL